LIRGEFEVQGRFSCPCGKEWKSCEEEADINGVGGRFSYQGNLDSPKHVEHGWAPQRKDPTLLAGRDNSLGLSACRGPIIGDLITPPRPQDPRLVASEFIEGAGLLDFLIRASDGVTFIKE